jgi:hypothetical protein
MPKQIQFLRFSDEDTVNKLGKAKLLKADYPKRAVPRIDFQKRFKAWQLHQKPDVVEEKFSRIKGIKLTTDDVSKIRAIHESTTPTAEAIVNQKLGADEVLGTLYSSLLAFEFTKMESELKTRQARATTDAASAKVTAEWAAVVKACQTAYAAGGVRGLAEADLKGFSKDLRSNRNNFTAITNIYNSGIALDSQLLGVRSSAVGAWVPTVAQILDSGIVSTTIGDLCSKPFAEGVFTKDFSRSFNLNVTLTVWCPTWSSPFRTCKKTFTLAGISFSFGINVGYKVNCCGATAWGQAYAEACGTIIGIKVCAGCTGSITGVAGIGQTGSGSSCTYGIGINAQLKCTFAGVTVFQAQVPFGFNVSGPCPPAGICN